MSDDGALRFAERVVSLVHAGHKTATYKLATLLALIDVAAEATDPLTGPPDVLSARRVGQRVIELYWPQTMTFATDGHGNPVPLRQSAQNDIVAKLASWRSDHRLASRASLLEAREADPAGWDRLEGELIAVVIGMPLAKLQRFGEGSTAVEDRFIYDFGWRDEIKQPGVERPGFDDRLHLRPGVGGWLVQLAPLLRPVVQATWASLVARRNPNLVDDHQLAEFLFGATRVSLDPLRAPLLDSQDGRCFYCHQPARRVEVDHFIPWSRHPDNSLDNLVAACASCNNAKSASIAGHRHLETWTSRLRSPAFDEFFADSAWPRHTDRTFGSVNSTYLWLPEGTRLWLAKNDYEPVDPDRVNALLADAG